MGGSGKTAAERSTKLGPPGAPAGDADAIVEQRKTDRRVIRRRSRLIEEAQGIPRDRELEPRDELSEDSIAKTVDDLVE